MATISSQPPLLFSKTCLINNRGLLQRTATCHVVTKLDPYQSTKESRMIGRSNDKEAPNILFSFVSIQSANYMHEIMKMHQLSSTILVWKESLPTFYFTWILVLSRITLHLVAQHWDSGCTMTHLRVHGCNLLLDYPSDPIMMNYCTTSNQETS